MLAVPDKRHCFDVLQPLTSTGDVLQAHLDGRTMPTPGAVFDDLAYNAVRGDDIGWVPGDGRSLRFVASLEAAADAYQSLRRVPTYRDVHVWRFVPSSFRLILGTFTKLEKSGYARIGFTIAWAMNFTLRFPRPQPAVLVSASLWPRRRCASTRQSWLIDADRQSIF